MADDEDSSVFEDVAWSDGGSDGVEEAIESSLLVEATGVTTGTSDDSVDVAFVVSASCWWVEVAFVIFAGFCSVEVATTGTIVTVISVDVPKETILWITIVPSLTSTP